MRAFIAIDLPKEARDAINRVIDEARRGTRGVKWVPVDNLHLTLKFLGEVKEELVPGITGKLKEIAGRHRPFSVGVRGTGAFPNPRRPRVLWVGLDASDELEALFTDIDAAMELFGFAREARKFSPHLTIARVREGADLGPAPKVMSTYGAAFFGTIDVHNVFLMESILRPTGSEYRRVGMAEFMKS